MAQVDGHVGKYVRHSFTKSSLNGQFDRITDGGLPLQ